MNRILISYHPAYETRLRNLVKLHNLGQQVTFHEPIPREDLPKFLGEYDVLVLPSIWEEPLALIMQEGLASGMVVIGSATGGTKEIIIDNENGMLFKAGDDKDLAEKMNRLINDPLLLKKLSQKGRITAQQKFDLKRMVDDLEQFLQKVVLNENAPDFHN